MNFTPQHWHQFYNQTPLNEVPVHFANMRQSPFLMEYLAEVLRHCPRGGRTLETGVGSGFGAVWLSQRGCRAEGIDNSVPIVERARQVNNILGGRAEFKLGDLFELWHSAGAPVNGAPDPVAPRSGRLDNSQSAICNTVAPLSFQSGPGARGWGEGSVPQYAVVHHQGVLEHFTVPQIHAALAQQVALANWVVFSVPSVYYPDADLGDERLMPIEEWQRILEPFQIEDLKYYGHPQAGNRDHILCVLQGFNRGDAEAQRTALTNPERERRARTSATSFPRAATASPALTLGVRYSVSERPFSHSPYLSASAPPRFNSELLAMMRVPDEPYPQGISAIVHTRNEERHIADCLASLQGWTDEIIVCDMESSDATVEIASRFTDNIVHHPLIANFDRARNVSAMRASYRWVFYLDADERVPPGLGEALRGMALGEGCDFEAMLIPFRHHFTGHWMRCLYPGYTAPRLFKNGKFLFNARLHSGAQVDGRITNFPANNPELAIVHYEFDSMSHHIEKMNRYTNGEAANMYQDGQAFDWRDAVRDFVDEFQRCYDQGHAYIDGPYGFIYSFLSAFDRFGQHAKLFELRDRAGKLQPSEMEVPGSVQEMLEFALSVLDERTAAALIDSAAARA